MHAGDCDLRSYKINHSWHLICISRNGSILHEGFQCSFASCAENIKRIFQANIAINKLIEQSARKLFLPCSKQGITGQGGGLSISPPPAMATALQYVIPGPAVFSRVCAA